MIKEIKKNNVKFKVDASLKNSLDFWNMLESGVWEPYTFTIFDKYLSLNHSYIDIGAWIGPTALYAAEKSKKVYAIEPDETAFKELQKNVNINSDLKNKISLFKKCISNTNGTTQLGNTNKWGNSGSSLLCKENWKVSTQVETLTLETFIQENNINDCSFIKIDIEGAETLVLPNIKDYLNINKPVVYLSIHPPFFNNINEDYKNIIETLSIYKNIYDTNNNRISLDSLFQKRNFYSIVCTD